jgi:hypothetical protein
VFTVAEADGGRWRLIERQIAYSGEFCPAGSAIDAEREDLHVQVEAADCAANQQFERPGALPSARAVCRGGLKILAGSADQTRTVTATGAGETKLLVRRGDIEIKVEVNFVMRGTVQSVRNASLSPMAREALQTDIEIPVTSLEDVYGGKLVAAMDRQHPRDLFDVMQLYAHEGITPAIRRAFVIYLASHNRPVHEVLFPALRDISQDYERSFRGMTTDPVDLSALISVRERLVADLQRMLETNERQFLLSLVKATPEWKLLDVAHLKQLPAIRWKLTNLDRPSRRTRIASRAAFSASTAACSRVRISEPSSL